MHSNISLFIIGLVIGLSTAFIGGLIEYWLTLRPGAKRSSGQPSCLLYVVGGLALAGIIAIIGSVILIGSVGEALIIGGGVLVGFYAGFTVSFGLWFLLDRNR